MDELHITWFLLHWYRHEGRTDVTSFDDQAEAFQAYIRAERDFGPLTRGTDPKLEIVLIGAESLEALQAAYPHYFRAGTREERAGDILAASRPRLHA